MGLTGVALLTIPGFAGYGEKPVGWRMLVLILTPVSWAMGSIYARQANLPDSVFLATSMEMIAGGVFQLLGAILIGEMTGFHLAQISSGSWWAWAYLGLVGSLVGFTSYIWVLHRATPALASAYAFVNPVIAVFLGWAWAGEPVTLSVILASGLIVGAVILIIRR